MYKCVIAAVAALSLFGAASAAIAQDPSAATAGGDVTADEATPLPPVVVQAPSEPPRKTSKRRLTPASSGASPDPDANVAGTVVVEGPAVAPFTLGQLDMIGGATITNEAMYTYNRNSLGQAVNVLPGVTWLSTGAPSINSSGSRNEGDIFVRGFNRFQVPLYMDGVRVYLPADNRIDMNRFQTPDLAEVQVAKGYVSVLNGPGGEGGAINMVSRKPTKEVELEGRAGAVFDGDLGSMGQWSSYAFGGTRQKNYYAQVSGTIVDQNHFDMSDDFTQSTYADSTTTGHDSTFPYEDGGNRDRSDFRDWRINAKVGITPNATDEYSINYTTQAGEKNAPLSVDRQIVQGYFGQTPPRYWKWPAWDTSSLSFLSKTQLGSASYIKTNAYYNTFDNTVSFCNNPTCANLPTNSPYSDNSIGGFVEVGTDLVPMNTLKGAIHYRRDEHNEWDVNNPTTAPQRTPTETSREETWSFAVENTFHATPSLDFVAGVSYDTNAVLQAESFSGGVIVSNPVTPEVDAWNWQAAAIYRYSPSGTVHASVSDRTRFPTLFERYSTRFDAKTAPDPNVAPERSTNYEIGADDTLFPGLHVASAVFYSDIEDSIQNVFYGNGNSSIVGVSPDGYYYGAELSADWDATRTLRIGGNYTYIERDLDFAEAAEEITNATQKTAATLTQMEGLPRHKAFLYMAWKATDKLTLTPSLELATDRVAMVTNCSSTLIITNTSSGATPSGAVSAHGNCNKAFGDGPANATQTRPNYINIGSYALLNFRADYAFTENFSAAVGVTNLLDQNYELSDGFPEPGRQFYATGRVRF